MVVGVSLVAVSGGSDSMALLDRLYKDNKDLVVAHVNYNFRESALRDENIVKEYCEKNKIKLEILKGFKYNKEDGNFENWARVIRYNFFAELYKKYNCECLYVGHNLDDLLETYFIQKERNSRCDFFGLKDEIFIYNMRVRRILLGYTKKELNDYCVHNNIKFGVDETNFDVSYLRNNLRHNVLLKLSREEKENIVKEINRLNVDKEKEYLRIHNLLNSIKCGNNIVDLNKFKENDIKDRVSMVYYFVIECVKEKISISEKRLLDIVSKIESSKPNIELGKFKEFILYKEYENLVIKKEGKEFSYIIEDLNSDLKEYEICNKGRKLERVVVSEDLFPLSLESYKGDNKIVNRLFIEKKIPISQRKNWPVVKDKLGRVLLVLNIEKFYNIMDSNSSKIEFYVRRKEEESIDE